MKCKIIRIALLILFLFLANITLSADPICLERIDLHDPSDTIQVIFENERVKIGIGLSDVLKTLNELQEYPSGKTLVQSINSYSVLTKIIERYGEATIRIKSAEGNDFEIEGVNDLLRSEYLAIVDSSGVHNFSSFYKQISEIFFTNLASGNVRVFSKYTGEYQSFIYISDPFPMGDGVLTFVSFYFPNGERFCSGVHSF